MPSVAQSAISAFNRMVRILFHPFEAGKWFTLGFSAFLASLGGGFQFHSNNLKHDWPGLGEWIQSHFWEALFLGAGLFLLVLALVVVLNWIDCRGQFMFLDNVIHDRAAIREPWNRFRGPANQLFVFQLLVGLGILAGLLLFGGLGIGAAFLLRPVVGPLGSGWMLFGIVILSLVVLALLTGLILFFLVLEDFVVPVMYQRSLTPADALRCFLRDLLPGRGWDFCRFYLLKLLMALGGLTAIVFAGCLTCCVGFLPYLSSVLTLPISVFFLCYNLDFLAQIDPGLNAFEAAAPEPMEPNP